LDATPSAPTIGNSIPAIRTPANRQRPNIFSRPSPTRTKLRVRGTARTARYTRELLTFCNGCAPQPF
jgi:hypothetical protein